jgi:hypothetical protein
MEIGLNSSSTLAIMDPGRARRESSVQRQTDTLRRLAQSRDVTPMLQTVNYSNQNHPYVPGQPPPPPWMDDSYYSPLANSSPTGSLAQFGTMDSGRVSLHRYESIASLSTRGRWHRPRYKQ